LPRSTREWALRELNASCNNVEWAEKHVLKVIDKYLDAHPEIAHPLVNILSLTEMFKKAVLEVRSTI